MSYVIGLTGGIASGKSTVGRLLEKRGLCRVDADTVARQVVEPGQPALEEVAERFGREVLQGDGSLNRAALGRLVFADPGARQDLEAILHPRIWGRLQAALQQAEQEQRETVVEIPLLYESGRESAFDTIWVVNVSRGEQIRRLTERDGIDVSEAEQRLDSQWPLQEKAARADQVINNEGEPSQLAAEVDKALVAWRESRR